MICKLINNPDFTYASIRSDLNKRRRAGRIDALAIVFLLTFSALSVGLALVLPVNAATTGGPTITSVTPITTDTAAQIVIQGSGFGNTFPATTPSPPGDGVDTYGNPSIAIEDYSCASCSGSELNSWQAGYEASPVPNYIGIYLSSWSNNQIVINGFGNQLGAGTLVGGVCTGPTTWTICAGDIITIRIWNNFGVMTSVSLIVGSQTASVYRLNVEVTNSSGFPVNGAVVNALVGNGKLIQTSASNSSGYALLNLSPGNYNVTASESGYLSTSQIVNLTSETSIRLTLARPYIFLGEIPGADIKITETATGYNITLTNPFASSPCDVFFDWNHVGVIPPSGGGFTTFFFNHLPNLIVMAAVTGSADYPEAWYAYPLPASLTPTTGNEGAFLAEPTPYATASIFVNPYPPVIGQPTTIGVTLHDPFTTPLTITRADFQISGLTIGGFFSSVGQVDGVTLAPGETQAVSIVWVSTAAGHHCVRVVLTYPDLSTQAAQRNLDIESGMLPGSTGTVTFALVNPLAASTDMSVQVSPTLPTGWTFGISVNGQDYGSASTISVPNVPSGATLAVTLNVNSVSSSPGIGTIDVTGYISGMLIGGVRKIMSVLPTPTLTTQLSATTVMQGGSVSDTAILAGGNDPAGTLTFFVSTVDSCPTIGATQVGSAAVVSGDGNYVSNSQSFNTAGNNYWYAAYSGDANNNAVTSPCEPLIISSSPSFSAELFPSTITAVPPSGLFGSCQPQGQSTLVLQNNEASPIQWSLSNSQNSFLTNTYSEQSGTLQQDATTLVQIMVTAPCQSTQAYPDNIVVTSDAGTNELSLTVDAQGEDIGSSGVGYPATLHAELLYNSSTQTFTFKLDIVPENGHFFIMSGDEAASLKDSIVAQLNTAGLSGGVGDVLPGTTNGIINTTPVIVLQAMEDCLNPSAAETLGDAFVIGTLSLVAGTLDQGILSNGQNLIPTCSNPGVSPPEAVLDTINQMYNSISSAESSLIQQTFSQKVYVIGPGQELSVVVSGLLGSPQSSTTIDVPISNAWTVSDVGFSAESGFVACQNFTTDTCFPTVGGNAQVSLTLSQGPITKICVYVGFCAQDYYTPTTPFNDPSTTFIQTSVIGGEFDHFTFNSSSSTLSGTLSLLSGASNANASFIVPKSLDPFQSSRFQVQEGGTMIPFTISSSSLGKLISAEFSESGPVALVLPPIPPVLSLSIVPNSLLVEGSAFATNSAITIQYWTGSTWNNYLNTDTDSSGQFFIFSNEPIVPGTTLFIRATDGLGQSTIDSIGLSSSAALSAGAITPLAPTIVSGESVTLTANPSGGISPYTVTWYTAAGAGACSTSDAPISTGLTYSPSPSASTYYCYIATDSETPPVSAASSTDLVTVTPPPPTAGVPQFPVGMLALIGLMLPALLLVRKYKGVRNPRIKDGSEPAPTQLS